MKNSKSTVWKDNVKFWKRLNQQEALWHNEKNKGNHVKHAIKMSFKAACGFVWAHVGTCERTIKKMIKETLFSF